MELPFRLRPGRLNSVPLHSHHFAPRRSVHDAGPRTAFRISRADGSVTQATAQRPPPTPDNLYAIDFAMPVAPARRRAAASSSRYAHAQHGGSTPLHARQYVAIATTSTAQNRASRALHRLSVSASACRGRFSRTRQPAFSAHLTFMSPNPPSPSQGHAASVRDGSIHEPAVRFTAPQGSTFTANYRSVAAVQRRAPRAGSGNRYRPHSSTRAITL